MNNAAVVFDQSTNGTYAGNMSGSGTLAKLGAGTLTLSGSNNYGGGTTVTDGTLQLGVGGVAGIDRALTVNGGTFDLNNNNQTVGALSGLGGGDHDLGSGTLTASSDGGNTTLASVISPASGQLREARHRHAHVHRR